VGWGLLLAIFERLISGAQGKFAGVLSKAGTGRLVFYRRLTTF
jgi:hypothetical protein